MSQPQRVTVRGKTYFVCDYTGAPITERYFIPFGKDQKKKKGCFATLPILLRAVLDEENGVFSPVFEQVKHDCEIFFQQPDIPVQPALALDLVPLSADELVSYVEKMELGLSWTLVPKSIPIDGNKQVKKRKTKH